MSEYQLTDKQKGLLRHIVSGLESGEVESHEMLLIPGDDGISAIFGLDGDTHQFWVDHLTESDLFVLDKNGFIQLGSDRKSFTIDEKRIVEAVTHDFKLPDVTTTYIIEGDVNAAVANIGGEIRTAGDLIATLNQIDADEREKLKILFGDLQRDLESLADREPEIAQKVSHTIRKIAEILDS